MRTLLLLLLFCHVSSPVTHTLKNSLTASTGIPNLPEFVATVEVDELVGGYCDSSNRLDAKHDASKLFFTTYPEELEWYRQGCFNLLPHKLKAFTKTLMRLLNQSGGVHVLQEVNGLEWDTETGEVKGFVRFGYDGEDFLALDPNTFTWNALSPEAATAKPIWDTNEDLIKDYKAAFTMLYPELLKNYVEHGWNTVLRTELPSVSLLQKTPSSPVSCHTTGFYPDRASLIWRKDGVELHEEVDHGEILPNHDGTFQMSVDLKLSSVTPEDWTRYDCVFQLYGVKEDIVTKLEKDRIRTNEGEMKPVSLTVPIAAAVVVLALALIGAAGFIVYKKKKAIRPPSSPDNNVELSEQLNPQT